MLFCVITNVFFTWKQNCGGLRLNGTAVWRNVWRPSSHIQELAKVIRYRLPVCLKEIAHQSSEDMLTCLLSCAETIGRAWRSVVPPIGSAFRLARLRMTQARWMLSYTRRATTSIPVRIACILSSGFSKDAFMWCWGTSLVILYSRQGTGHK